jgi:hypothetical protein
MKEEVKAECRERLRSLLAGGMPTFEDFTPLEHRLAFASVLGVIANKVGASKSKAARGYSTLMTYLSVATDEEIMEIVKGYTKPNKPAQWSDN